MLGGNKKLENQLEEKRKKAALGGSSVVCFIATKES